MIALIRAELLKVRTTRGWYAYLALVVLLPGLAAAATVGSEAERRGTVDFQADLVEAAGFAALLALILGITIVTAEFRHGTVVPTFLVTPVRERVIAAKTIAAVLVGLSFAVIAVAVVAAVLLIWLSIVGADLQLGSGQVAERVAQALLAAVLWALMGVAIGSLVHNQVGALVGSLIWIFVGETLIWGLFSLLDFEGAFGYLPFQSLDAADGTGGEDMLAYGPAVAVVCGWIALLGAAGVVRTRRRDIS